MILKRRRGNKRSKDFKKETGKSEEISAADLIMVTSQPLHTACKLGLILDRVRLDIAPSWIIHTAALLAQHYITSRFQVPCSTRTWPAYRLLARLFLPCASQRAEGVPWCDRLAPMSQPKCPCAAAARVITHSMSPRRVSREQTT